MPTRRLVLIVGTLLAATVIVAQQHSYTQEDITAGAKLYESNCGSCHGENGDKITGIDFSKSTFKTARTDDDVIRIIRNGVPNTGMPPSPLSEVQANTIVAFVRSMPGGARVLNAPATASLTGDAARGKTIFEGKGNCASCHAINGAGGTSGPDLVAGGGRGGRGAAAIPAGPGAPAAAGAPPAAGAPAAAGAAAGGRGGRGGAPGGGGAAAGGGRGGGQGARGGGGAPAAGGPPAGGGGRGGAAAPNPQQLERSIVDPSAEMAPQYRVYQVVTKANVTAKGTLLNQDTFSVQLRDNNDKLMSFWKSDLKEYGFISSPMPSYRGTLTAQEIADVVSYLVSLRSN